MRTISAVVRDGVRVRVRGVNVAAISIGVGIETIIICCDIIVVVIVVVIGLMVVRNTLFTSAISITLRLTCPMRITPISSLLGYPSFDARSTSWRSAGAPLKGERLLQLSHHLDLHAFDR